MNALHSEPWKLNSGWLEEPSWREVLDRATRLTNEERATALQTLREVFNPEWSAACTLAHGVAQKQLTYPGRLSLLELGHAASLTDVDHEFVVRLRDPNEYFGADAELRAALLLLSGGTLLERAQPGNGTRLSEFIARWPSGKAAIVEVKAIRMSDRVAVAERLTTQVVFALMARAGELPGVAACVSWNDKALFCSLQRAAVETVLAEVNAAFDGLKDHLGEEPAALPENWALGEIGSLRITGKASALRLDLMFDGYSPSAEEVFRRLRRRCNDALQQLASHPHLPGLIILDADADGLARNGLRPLASWARAKPQLGAVLLTEREYGVSNSYTNVCILPGPRLDEVLDALAPLEECDIGHRHFQPLCVPTSPCRALFAL